MILRELFRRRLAVQFSTAIFALVSVIILSVTGYLLFHERWLLEEGLQRQGLIIVNTLVHQSLGPLLQEDDESLLKLVRIVGSNRAQDRAGEGVVAYAMILDREERVVASTGPVRGQGLTPEGLVTSLIARKTTSPEWGHLYEIAAPIRMGSTIVGTVRVGMSYQPLTRMLWSTAGKVLSVLFLLMLVGIGTIWRFSHHITEPIKELSEGARRIAAGDLGHQVNVARNDEIGELSAAFNRMSVELKRSRDELRQKEEMRQRLLTQLITAQEEERKRISRGLHDEAGQALTSILVGLKLIENATDIREAHQQSGSLRALTVETLEALHDLSLNLRPGVLDELGLAAALEHYVKDFGAKHGLATDFQAHGFDSRRLPAPIETTMYRIAQEALTNVVRHARAANVSVLLERRGNSAILIVEDDGRGFEVESVVGRSRNEGRLGIFGMQERAFRIDGTLTIESSSGGGTTVFVEVPLSKAEE
ncbi:MAG: HAMP domain-containing protein [candidate division NC10 bacterium]|nr:HAMP domain-containing protein [candidate division NC10 bacterium]